MWTCLFSRLLEWRGNLLSTLLIVVGGHRSSTFGAEKQQENLENGIYIPNKIDAIFSYIFTLASLVATELLLPPKTQCSPWFWVEQGGKIWFVSSRLLVGHPGTEMENVLKTQRDILIPTQKKIGSCCSWQIWCQKQASNFFGMVHKTEMSFARILPKYYAENCILHVCVAV